MAIKAPYLKFLARAEKRIFSETDRDIITVLANLENPPNTLDNPVVVGNICEWKYLEVCHDWSSGIRWLGGVTNAPIHLDHDLDGVLNEMDQDYLDFLAATGIAREEFEQFIFDHWEQYLEAEFGIYADFWASYYDEVAAQYDSFDYDPSDGYVIDIADAFTQAVEDLGHNLDSFFEALGQWIGENFTTVPCYSMDIDCFSDDLNPDRSIDCDWYYYLDCGDVSDDWWENISNTQLCYVCPDLDDLPSGWNWYTALQNHYNDQDLNIFYSDLQITYDDLEDMVEFAGCDDDDPDFDECILRVVYQHLLTEIQTELLEFPITFSDGQWLLDNPAKVLYLWDYYQNHATDHETIVRPFLKPNGANIIDLLRADIDFDYCLNGDFEECIMDKIYNTDASIVDVVNCTVCEAPWSRYIPCSEITFSQPIAPSQFRYSKSKILMNYNIVGCIPGLGEGEGIWRNVLANLIVDVGLPNNLFSGAFGYAQQQTNLANYYTEALNYATEVIDNLGVSCGNVVTRSQGMVNEFFNYLNDPDNKAEYWGNQAPGIIFKRNDQTNTPGYEISIVKPSFDPTHTNCL